MSLLKWARQFVGSRFIQLFASFAFFLMASGAPSSASAASFDCSKARQGVEQAICFDQGLSRMDEEMALAYKDLLVRVPDKEPVKQSQRDWLRFSRNVCQSIDCLRAIYAARIETLRSGRPEELKFTGSLNDLYVALDSVPSGISYGPTNDKPVQVWLQDHRLLENAVASVGGVTPLPKNLRVTARQCGEPNAFYFGSKNAIVLCYELVRRLSKAHSERQGDQNIEGRRLSLSVRFVLLHEFGHAVFKWNSNEGLLGREESAADSFASVLLLKDLVDLQSVSDALWGVWTKFQVLKTIAVYHPSDEHEYSDQRLANFACMVGGRAPSILSTLVDANLLTKARGRRCEDEWNSALRGVRSIAKKSLASR